jgi:hypothetical protein
MSRIAVIIRIAMYGKDAELGLFGAIFGREGTSIIK